MINVGVDSSNEIKYLLQHMYKLEQVIDDYLLDSTVIYISDDSCVTQVSAEYHKELKVTEEYKTRPRLI